MSRLSLPVLALLVATPRAPSVVRSPMSQRVDLNAAVDSIVDRQIATDAFSGVVLFTDPGGRTYQRAGGVANRQTGARMTPDTKLQIASITKLYTQIAVRQLEQAGKLSLSDTVGKFLPNYHNATVRSRVTVDQLLRHRSGVGSFWNERFFANRAKLRTIDDYIALFQDDSLLFAPGTNEAYSNGGYVLLGAIVERASGMSYHDYVRQHVFGPAGMTETMPYDSRTPRSNAAVGYTFQSFAGALTGDRRLAGMGPRPGYDSAGAAWAATPGGSPPATPPLAARMRLVGPDGKELSPEDARAAMTQHVAGGRERSPNVQASTSGPAGDDYSTAGDFVKLARALVGRKLLDSARTAAVLGDRYARGGDFRAAGGGPGSNAEFSIFPNGDVVVVLSNYDPPAATTIAQFIRSRLSPPAAPR